MATAEYYQDHADLLRRVELFAGLDRVVRAKLAARLEPMTVVSGEVLVRQGETGDSLYIISQGSFGVYVSRESDGQESRLGIRHRGDPIGEMALLTDETRSATVRAESDGEVLRLDRVPFLELTRQDPSVGLAIAVTLTKRLRTADAARVSDATHATTFDDVIVPDFVGDETGGQLGRRDGRADVLNAELDRASVGA